MAPPPAHPLHDIDDAGSIKAQLRQVLDATKRWILPLN
jgi:hypothetical protein